MLLRLDLRVQHCKIITILVAQNSVLKGGKHRAWLHPAGVERVRLAQVDDGEAVGHVRAHVADLCQEFPVLF